MEELILKEREVREKIVETINNSGLPAFILKPIFKEMYDQISMLAGQQYEEAKNNKIKKEVKENGISETNME